MSAALAPAMALFVLGALAVGLWFRPAPLPRRGRDRIEPTLTIGALLDDTQRRL